MGVMPCSRNGCKAILCTKLILGASKYLCDECYQELLKMKEIWKEHNKISPDQLEHYINKFLDSTPKSFASFDEKWNQLIGE